MERGLSDELQQIKAAITKFSELSLTSKDASSSISNRISQNLTNQEESRDGGRPLVSAKLAKLEFPKYSGDDPTEWFTRVDQFFEYQGTPDSEKVSLASYHLRGEANEWWQWLRRTHTEAGTAVTWAIFSEELWSRFGPTDCEDFDESLSKIRQTGLLRDYQREFERLGNRVKGWTQKALVGTFMGGLKPEIAEGIRMFKPKTLKEAISLARMRDEQLLRQKKAIRPSYQTSFLSPTTSKPSTPKNSFRGKRCKIGGRKDCALIVMRSLFLDTGVLNPNFFFLMADLTLTTMMKMVNLKFLYTHLLGGLHQTLQRESSKWGSSSMQWKIQKYSSSLARYTLLNYVLFLANHGFGCGIRGTVAAAIGDSPMQLGQVDYGFYLEWGAATPARHPPGVPRYEGGHSPIHEVDQTLQTRDEILRELKSHLSRAANQMKQYVDLKRRDVEFQVGDHVYLKLQPYRQQSVSKRASQKLASRYFGPYRVLERVGKLAYKLELPAGSKVHPVFHVSLLKQHIGDTFPVSDVLPLLSDDGEAILEPATILDTRWIRRGSRTIQESLVLWKHLPQEDATWENSVELQVRFPNLNLEDKVPFKGGSNDGTLRRSSRIPIKIGSI
ncbi:hypothetical protein GH714_039010 [Hevea brasiliensis]|uniref:Uncharacterized protein n=1 Tax=Hevea brasiliensis TaxID=3981 RepID=A0A6A6K8S7_HEVBR|nr:hypothetical protein GH714_039010 [Hevea brasiliensis]